MQNQSTKDNNGQGCNNSLLKTYTSFCRGTSEIPIASQNHNQLIFEFRKCRRKNAAPRLGAVKALHYKTMMVDGIHALLIGFSQNDFVNLCQDKQ